MEYTPADWALIIPSGAAISALGTLVGIGGGVFMVPILVLVLGVPLKAAVPAVTLCMFPSALLSSLFNARRGLIDYRAAAALEFPTLFGAVAGAALTAVLPVRPLEAIFAVFVGWMASRFIRPLRTAGPSLVERFNHCRPVWRRPMANGGSYTIGVPAVLSFGFVSGLMAGLFGVGGGVIKTPVMLKIFRMPPRHATATALFMIVFTSATGSISHWRLGNLDWHLALPLCVGFTAGSLIGNTFGQRLKNEALPKLLGYTLALASLTMLARVALGMLRT